jgi:phage terminase large subunit-like protein
MHASRGKQLRAEPVVSLYEQGRVHHVGVHAELEEQMTTWVPGIGRSPDRVDALVYALTELSGGKRKARMIEGGRLPPLSERGGGPAYLDDPMVVGRTR